MFAGQASWSAWEFSSSSSLIESSAWAGKILWRKVKEQYERQSGAKPRKFKAVLVRTQVVTGTNYFFKVDTGRDTYSHVRVFVPQPGLDEEPTLECFQADKTKDDELVYFLADDNRL